MSLDWSYTMKTKYHLSWSHRILRIIIAVFVTASFLAYSGAAYPLSNAQFESFIVQGTSTAQVTQLVERYGGSITSQLEIIHGVGALLPAHKLAMLRLEPGIIAVTPNVPVIATGQRNPSTDYPDVVGADVVWNQGNLGEGVTVAVVDTGLGWHPGFYTNTHGRIDDRVVGWVDFVNGSRIPFDPNGHGTHIGGIIANAQKDSEGEWNGMAPGVDLVGVRVLDQQGAGTYERVIEGLQWVLDHQAQYNIKIINLSLSSPVQSPYWADPLNQAVMQAWAAGITVVVAAGNGGSGPMSVGVPGNNPYVITVGAFTDNYTPLDWDDDYIAPFSAAGPTLDGFVKPDVVAPGAHMVAPMMPSSYLARNHEANKVTALYFSMAGTSQATAVVSGEAALILAQHPELTPDQVKFRIIVTSLLWVDPTTTEALYSMWQQGAGRVNVPDAVYADISESANAGMDIQEDIAGQIHYEGYSYYDDEIGAFRLRSGYGTWSGGYGTWSGNEPWAGSLFEDPAFVTDYLNGVSPDPGTSSTTIGQWLNEP